MRHSMHMFNVHMHTSRSSHSCDTARHWHSRKRPSSDSESEDGLCFPPEGLIDAADIPGGFNDNPDEIEETDGM